MKLDSKKAVNKVSFWTSPVTEDVEAPRIHLIAIVLYGCAMTAYSIFAVYEWFTFERPVKFESQPTFAFDAVPLT